MQKRFLKGRRARYGGITVVLTVLLVAVVVLANVLFGTLASRYQWYSDLRSDLTYGVSEKCYRLLHAALDSAESETGGAKEVRILFCDTPENLMSSSTSSYVYQTALSLSEKEPDRIKIECKNIWLDPDSVRPYMTTTVIDRETGVESEQTVTIKSTSVILVCGDYHRVYTNTEFYIFKGGDTSQVWAYNGEKKLAAGILRAIAPNAPRVCLTNNHGEAYYDYEIIYLLDDAGYQLDYVDLSKETIPSDCRLLICFNPNKDLTVESDISSLSEPAVLDAFLETSGHTFLVFLENGTPSLPNLEAYLEGWGVSTLYHKSGETSYRYMVQDTSGTLTSDGYTIYGKAAATGYAGELLSGLTQPTVFKNATALRASNGFTPNGDGSYTKGNRTMYALYETTGSAVSWANGAPVDGDGAILMSLTEQKSGEGCSRVGVVSSVRFATEDFLQSAVYGNTDTMLRLLGRFGDCTTPEGLTIKPFQSTDMSLVTTAQKLRWTLLLSIVPAVIVIAVAVPVLVRRKHS